MVHLARARNGIEPLKAFLESYRRMPAGIEHTLVLALKGFGRSLGREFEAILRDVDAERVALADSGYDIGTYRTAARTLSARKLCFLNSFSVILGDAWLAKLHTASLEPGVGLVGASASWQSLETNYRLQQAQPFGGPGDPARWLFRALRYQFMVRGRFPSFPNPHVRTNAFLIERDLFLRVGERAMKSKWDAYCFESGRAGLSRRVAEAGLSLKVVGRDGVAYAPKEWPRSHTAWSGEQENLLVADNQSRLYEQGDSNARAALRRYAWGEESETLS